MNAPKDPPPPPRNIIDLSSRNPLDAPTKLQPTSLEATVTTMNDSTTPIDSAADEEDESFGVFGARAVDQADLEWKIATKVRATWALTLHHSSSMLI